MAIGTAIRIPGEPPTKTPFTSDLSGQEFWQLRQAGYVIIFTQSIWNNLTSPGPCRDLLIIATGTAIAVADSQPPPPKTLLLIPLNK